MEKSGSNNEQRIFETYNKGNSQRKILLGVSLLDPTELFLRKSYRTLKRNIQQNIHIPEEF